MPRKKTEEKSEAKEEIKETEEVKEEKAEKKASKKKKTEKKEEEKTEDKKAKKEDNLLVPLEDYIKAGVHLGTKIITAQMRQYIFKKRADGLAIINTNEIDSKIRTAASFLAQYDPDKIVVSCKRQAGWLALEKFSELTGARVFTKKYPAGIITNLTLPDFFEPSLMMVIDPWIDKNPMMDAVQIQIPIVSLCDSNNLTSFVDMIIPCNNKSNKSIGLIFWILAREYNRLRGNDVKMPPYEEFIGESI